jgi:hypothetical protein
MKVGGEYKSFCESYCDRNEGQNELGISVMYGEQEVGL